MTAIEIIKQLVEFQWNYIGYGVYRCRSCGALGEETDSASIRNVEECSLNCKFRRATEWLRENK